MIAGPWRISCHRGISFDFGAPARSYCWSCPTIFHNLPLKRGASESTSRASATYTATTRSLRCQKIGSSVDERHRPYSISVAQEADRKELQGNERLKEFRVTSTRRCRRVSTFKDGKQEWRTRGNKSILSDLRSPVYNQHAQPFRRRAGSSWAGYNPSSDSIIWRHKSFPKRRSLAVDLRKNYSPQVWRLISRALPKWYSETDYVFGSIQEGSRFPAGIPKELSSFSRFVKLDGKSTVHTGAIYRAWSARSWKGKAVWWRHALHLAMLHSREDALRIISDISRRPFLQVPGNAMAEALLLIDAKYVADDIYHHQRYYELLALQQTACTYLENYTKREGTALLPWCIIRRLSKALSVERLQELVQHVLASKTPFTLYTKLHTMHHYLELNHLSLALDLFGTFSQEELANRAVQSFCVSVLRMPWVVGDIHSFRRQLTQFFLEKGLKPSFLVRNVIMQNYLESGDRESAWHMLDTIRQRGLITTAHTYANFLKFTSWEDTNTINALYEMARQDKVLDRSIFLCGFFIHIAASNSLSSEERSFHNLYSLFQDLFETTDLEEMGMVKTNTTSNSMKLLRPNSFAIQWMLMSWLHENKNDPEKVTALYNNYQFHLRNNHPRISLLAFDGYVNTAFILAFGHSKSHLHMCTKVLQDMLQPRKPLPLFPPEEDSNLPDYEKFLEPEEPEEKSIELRLPLLDEEDRTTVQSLKANPFSYHVGAPTSYIWNSLLMVLLRHRQFDAAEGTLQAMQRAGFQPDNVTWNILIKGFVERNEPYKLPTEDLGRLKPRPDSESLKKLPVYSKESKLLQRFKENLAKERRDQEYIQDDEPIPSWKELERDEIAQAAEPLQHWENSSLYHELQSRS